jgi:hypothetical protein
MMLRKDWTQDYPTIYGPRADEAFGRVLPGQELGLVSVITRPEARTMNSLDAHGPD